MEAAQAAHQALEILAPFVEHYPETFGQLARTIGAGVLTYSEAGAQPANMALLERVAQALGGGGSGEQDPAIRALNAKIRHREGSQHDELMRPPSPS